MSMNNKQITEKKSSRLEKFFKSTLKMQRRDDSNLSPLENNQLTKKINLDEENTTIDDLGLGEQENKNPNMPNSSLKQIIGPLIDEVKALRNHFTLTITN